MSIKKAVVEFLVAFVIFNPLPAKFRKNPAQNKRNLAIGKNENFRRKTFPLEALDVFNGFSALFVCHKTNCSLGLVFSVKSISSLINKQTCLELLFTNKCWYYSILLNISLFLRKKNFRNR